jgi:hypothetical protein
VNLDVNLDTVKTWGLILGIGLPILGVVLALVVKSVVLKVLFLIVFVGLGVAIWTQRAALLEYADTCAGKATFFGVEVSVPQAVRDACGTVGGG